MAMEGNFQQRLESKLKQQLSSQKVGFLLGAGSSYLDGNGYPLAGSLWNEISAAVPKDQREDIQNKLDDGALGIEHALDLLDQGDVSENPHRYSVTAAIAQHFSRLSPPLEIHRDFVARLGRRRDKIVNLFSLNYDPLIEQSGELEKVRILDGYQGHQYAYFDAASFQYDIAMIQHGGRGGRVRRDIAPCIRLSKLHGSMGWFESPDHGVRRSGFCDSPPEGARRLMIPPQKRKSSDVVQYPYSTLWTEFRQKLVHGPGAINRLLCVGYGMADEHVNDIIEGALARPDFILIVISKALTDSVFTRWSEKRNVIIMTEDRCSLYGELGNGHEELWSFEGIVKEL
jgi:hypothetical protein